MSESSLRIATFTVNPAVDLNASVQKVEPDRKLRCEAPTREPGGGGLNVSRAIRTLGGDSMALWTRGGVVGDLLHQLLEQERLTHRALPVPGHTRENVLIHETSTERAYRFGMPGPILGEAHAEEMFAALTALEPRPDYVVASGSLPPGLDEGLYSRIASIVTGWGSRLVLDASGEPLRIALEGGETFLVKPNLRELAYLEGRPFEGDVDIAKAAGRLVEKGLAWAVVVSMGAAGALVVAGDGTSEWIAAPPVSVRSRIGAGDSMVAGLVLALARGEPVGRAARFGVAAGAAAVMTPGTQLCRRVDAERLFEEMTDRGPSLG